MTKPEGTPPCRDTGLASQGLLTGGLQRHPVSPFFLGVIQSQVQNSRAGIENPQSSQSPPGQARLPERPEAFHFTQSPCHPLWNPVHIPALWASGLCSHISLKEELTTPSLFPTTPTVFSSRVFCDKLIPKATLGAKNDWWINMLEKAACVNICLDI